MQSLNVAIVGATGAVGESLREILQERDFPMGDVHLLASPRSAGSRFEIRGRYRTVQVLDEFDFADTQVAFFSAGRSVSAIHAPRAADAGAIVIDNTSQFRYEDHVPLVVPEVNRERVKDGITTGIIANPNCSTIQMVIALKPIYDAVGIERVNVATYQAVSGAGNRAIKELASQTVGILNAKPIDPDVHPVQIAFNAIPQIGKFQENGYTQEEMKMVWETRKIFEDDSIQVNPTCVRIPVFVGHSEAIHVETSEEISEHEAKELFNSSPSVQLVDEHQDGGYPTAVGHAAGSNKVFVGRVRKDITHPCGLNMWVVADNVRNGGAFNSVQIAEELASLL